MKRIFTFGCSYTSYSWPTWADIVAKDLGAEFYNYGRAGIGNVGIMHEIVKADLEHKFTDDDVILVLWSHWHREDRWRNGNWAAAGSVFNNPFYDKKFIKKYWDYQNDVVKNATAIISVNKMYPNILKFQGHMMYPGQIENDLESVNKNKDDVNLYNFYLSRIPDKNVFQNNDPYWFDGHPSVLSHLNYVIKNVYHDLGYTIRPETVDYYTEMDKELRLFDAVKMNYDDKIKKVAHAVREIENKYEKDR